MRAAHPWCAFSYTFVYRFHVPLLFLLSGMGCTLTAQKNRSLSARQFVRKKAHSLLLPWGIYSWLFIRFVLHGKSGAAGAGAAVRQRIPVKTACGISLVGAAQREPLWFSSVVSAYAVLVCPHGMAVGQSLVPGGSRAAKLVLVVALPACYQLLFTGWFWAVKSYFQQGAFFFLGCVLPREKAEQRAKPLMLLVPCAVYGWCGDCCSPTMVWPDGLLAEAVRTWVDYFKVSGFCVGIWAACVLLQKPLRRLVPLGQNTMLFYLYHQPFCCAVPGLVLYEKLGVSAGGTVLVCGTASLVLPYLFCRLAGRLHLRPLLRRLGLPG